MQMLYHVLGANKQYMEADVVKMRKHVGKQVEGSPIITGSKAKAEYAKWNAKLEAEGLRLIDDNYRGDKAFTVKADVKAELGPGTETMEFYTLFKAYCVYYNYKIKTVSTAIVGRRRIFKRMLRLFVGGLSMQDCYNAMQAYYDEPIGSAIYYYKLLQKAKQEFIGQFSLFNGYIEYCKYHWGTPQSYEQWKLHR